MKIGKLAKQTGISIRMLRYYGEQGLLSPSRTESGYRDYSEADQLTVERIKSLGESGMTLDTIRHFLPCMIDQRTDFEPCDDLIAILQNQIETVTGRMKNLEESRLLLTNLLHEVDNRR